MTWDEWWANCRARRDENRKHGKFAALSGECLCCGGSTIRGARGQRPLLCNDCRSLGVMWCHRTGHLLSPGTQAYNYGRECVRCSLESRLCQKYGLLIGEYSRLRSYAVECGLCGGEFKTDAGPKSNWAPVLDHHHGTGVKRGFLHQACNKALGEMESISKERGYSMYNVAMMVARWEKYSRNGGLLVGAAS